MEEKRDRLSLVGNEIVGNIKTLMHPVISYVRITALLHGADRAPTTILKLAAERIQALFGRLIRIGVPPVGHCNFGIACWNCVTLPDAIIATCIAAEVGAVLAAIGVRGVNQLVSFGGRLLPWSLPIFEITVL